jgi:hypothetical protein
MRFEKKKNICYFEWLYCHVLLVGWIGKYFNAKLFSTLIHNIKLLGFLKVSTSNWFLYGQLQAGKDLQYGRVSPAELVQAVQEMLSAAGIYMDVEKQSLLQKTITLQEQLKESQTSLLLEQVCDNYASFAVSFFYYCKLAGRKCL